MKYISIIVIAFLALCFSSAQLQAQKQRLIILAEQENGGRSI